VGILVFVAEDLMLRDFEAVVGTVLPVFVALRPKWGLLS